MNTTYLGHRPRKTYDTHNFSATLQLAQNAFQRANYLEAFDIYEQLVTAYPAQSIEINY